MKGSVNIFYGVIMKWGMNFFFLIRTAGEISETSSIPELVLLHLPQSDIFGRDEYESPKRSDITYCCLYHVT